MKNSILICTALVSTGLLYSCSQNNGSANKQAEKPLSTTCYMALDGKDTSRMELNTFSKNVKGNLVISYSNKDNNNGEFEGELKGDTLLVIYTFKVGNKPTIYKNPLAFLKKDGKLIMGVGEMESALGRTYFKKGVPIDFGKGRFTYASVECKKESK
ncbi:hypothetical protein H7F33_12220 [Pedobacter sp. PAMC26386]|nr:hypothetical protein H7F33_12220 [Pedobacter sp. PAMC26386]